jgi:hypothetical protein
LLITPSRISNQLAGCSRSKRLKTQRCLAPLSPDRGLSSSPTSDEEETSSLVASPTGVHAAVRYTSSQSSSTLRPWPCTGIERSRRSPRRHGFTANVIPGDAGLCENTIPGDDNPRRRRSQATPGHENAIPGDDNPRRRRSQVTKAAYRKR